MSALALYRLPYADQYTLIEQLDSSAQAQPQSLPDIDALEGQTGFVLIPFADDGSHPVRLIRPDRVNTYSVDTLPQLPDDEACRIDPTDNEEADFAAYAKAFGLFHSAICNHLFDKLVLSRCQHYGYARTAPTWLQMQSLFRRACQAYPRMMVYLVAVGEEYWLGCTPEILLDGGRSHYRTVALAGTMRADEDADRPALKWDDKNRCEQALVARYIRDVLRPNADVIEEEGPYTSRAGHLLHLKTEFHFAPTQPFRLCQMVSQLHPTPAVCGLPKQEARRFILANEGYDRNYYSGVIGPFCLQGDTHLYVNLRCARFDAQGVHFYVGGGLLPDSELSSEWQETRSKMQTILSLLS